MTDSKSPRTAPEKSARNRKFVESRLIASACRLMAERGPKIVTIRDIAGDAGVNHGQIHHYFGGKMGLLKAAMHHLAHEHAENAAQRSAREQPASVKGILSNPPPLTLAEDRYYQLAVLRCVLDGEFELATVDVNEGVSVPRKVLEETAQALGQQHASTDLKAAIAVAMCIEQAWAALDKYILYMIQASPDETAAIRETVAKESRALLNRLLDAHI